MKNFSKITSFCTILLAASAAEAQSLGSVTRVLAVPDGVYFSVDGQNYNHAMSAIWPAGSKHTLSADTEQDGVQTKTRYTFGGWQASGGVSLPVVGSTLVITADPSIASYQATFNAQYAVSLNFNPCSDPAHCPTVGTIYAGGTAYASDADIWTSPGGSMILLAVPGPGYVFGGWAPGPGQAISGAVDTVTANQPVTVYPRFQVARPVNLATAPAGLQVLADRATVTTPVSLDWGWNSTHSVGPVSPQEDRQGTWWVFSSWSDGGAANHAYTVGQSTQPDTLTATYVLGSPVAVATSPANLQISVDGSSNWPSYNFLWGVGETHHLSAAAQQTDATGHIWAFASWSDGGAAAHDFTVPASIAGTGVRLVATYTPVGHLTINSSLAGLAVQVDGTSCATPCDLQRPLGTTVHVSAPASVPQSDGVRADFLGWPGTGTLSADWSGTLTGDPVVLNANYHTMNRLSASSTPAKGASFSLQPGSADGFYDSQASVSVLVSALPGYRFQAWSGDLSGSKPAGTLAMSAPRAVVAQLSPVPYIAPAGVSNAAGATPQNGVAPGSIVSIFGASLTSAASVAPAGPLAQTLGGLTVQSGGGLLPLFFVSPTQINLQLPDSMALGPQTLTVSSPGQPDVQGTFTTVRNAPGLFPQFTDGQSFAVAFHEDGSAVTADAPAIRGELLTVYGTGFGPAAYPRPFGFPIPATPVFTIVDPASMSVGGAPFTVENAFAVPGSVGLDAAQFRVDSTVASGNASIFVTVNGQSSNVVLLPVQ